MHLASFKHSSNIFPMRYLDLKIKIFLKALIFLLLLHLSISLKTKVMLIRVTELYFIAWFLHSAEGQDDKNGLVM